MKPEEAIKRIENLIKGREDPRGKTELDFALDMAIKALKDRPHGKWIRRHYITATKSFDMYVCSNCGEEFSYDAETGVSMDNYKTCPNCGADMRKREEG